MILGSGGREHMLAKTCAKSPLAKEVIVAPGNGGMAIVLGVFLILGLRPGPEMVTTKLDSTMMMVWVIVVANVVAAILALLLQKWLVLLCY